MKQKVLFFFENFKNIESRGSRPLMCVTTFPRFWRVLGHFCMGSRDRWRKYVRADFHRFRDGFEVWRPPARKSLLINIFCSVLFCYETMNLVFLMVLRNITPLKPICYENCSFCYETMRYLIEIHNIS